MQYTKAQVAFCDTTDFKRLPLAMRGVWLQLCIFCAKEENGGQISGAVHWDDTDWLMSGGLKKKDISAAKSANLVSWNGDSLVVFGYDKTGEDKCVASRTAGKLGGRPKRSENLQVNHPDNLQVNDPENRIQTYSTPSHPTLPHPNSPPSPPSILATTTTAGGGIPRELLRKRTETLDIKALSLAVKEGRVAGVPTIFGVTPGHDEEWGRELDGQVIGKVVAVFQWRRRRQGSHGAIRMPSGFRQAITDWDGIDKDKQRGLAVEMLSEVGISIETEVKS